MYGKALKEIFDIKYLAVGNTALQADFFSKHKTVKKCHYLNNKMIHTYSLQ